MTLADFYFFILHYSLFTSIISSLTCGVFVFDLRTQQLADGHLQHFGKTDQGIGVWDGTPLLPFLDGLLDHMKPCSQLLLRKALLFSERFKIFAKHAVSHYFAIKNSEISALPQATQINIADKRFWIAS